MAQLVFSAEMAFAQESVLGPPIETPVDSAVCVGWAEVSQYLSISCVSPDFLRYHVGGEYIRPIDCDEALLAVILSQPVS